MKEFNNQITIYNSILTYLYRMFISKNIFLFLILLTTTNVLVGQLVSSSFDLPFPATYYQEVNEKRDPELQSNLEEMINNNPLWKSLVGKKRMSVAIVDLREMANIRYASVNGKNMVYAASLPKIAVLLSAMEAVNEGFLEYTPALKKDLRLMIAKSNNAATTRVIEMLGYDRIAQTMERNKYGLYDRSDGGGLWVGKKYAKSGARNPDPLKGISHAANVDQVARFYTMLAYGKLVNKELNLEMMKYLIDPEIHHKFVKSLDRLDPDVDIYRKSGSWKQFHCDSALVFGENGRRYIIVALIEDTAGSRICTNLVAKAELALGIGTHPYRGPIDTKTKVTMRPATSGDD
jgi:beta-lactamase class A